MPQLANGLGLSRARFSGASFVGPLDDYQSSLTGLWLPRRAFTSYTGIDAVVRDTSDDAEQDVLFAPAGPAIFPAVTGDAAVTTASDQCGAADWVNATAAEQPLLIDGVVNGLPVIRVESGKNLIVTLGSSAARTLYLVARKRSAAAGASVLSAGGFHVSGTATGAILADYSGSTGAWAFRGAGFGTVVPIGGDVETWTVLTVVWNSIAAYSAWQNNNTPVTGNPIDNPLTGSPALSFGSSSAGLSADVDIAAIAHATTAHDDTTRQGIQTILANMFGITLA